MTELDQNFNPGSQAQPGTQQPAAQQAAPQQPAAQQAAPQQPAAQQPAAQQAAPQQPAAQQAAPQQAAPQQPAAQQAAPQQFDTPIQQIIDQQNAQIAALMAQNASLNAQVVNLVQSGGQLKSQESAPVSQIETPASAFPSQIEQMAQLGPQPDPFANGAPVSLGLNEDVSLEALASQIQSPEERR